MATTAINDGKWHHLVAVRTGGHLYLYQDLVKTSANDTTVNSFSTRGNLNIGRSYGSLGVLNSRDNIADVRIYNRALTATEIFELFDYSPVAIISPSARTSVSGTITLSAIVSDPISLATLAGIQFYLDGTPIGNPVSSSPYNISWNSFLVSNGQHIIGAKAIYDNGVLVSATDRTVFVSNGDGLMLQVVPSISGNKILPTMSSLPGVISQELNMTAARGEFEPVSFVIKPLNSDLTNVMLSATALQNGSNIIPQDSVDIKSVKVWYQSGSDAWLNTGVGDKVPTLTPELLLNDDGLVIVDRNNLTNFVKLTNGATVNVSSITSTITAYTLSEFPVRDATSFQPIAHIPAGDIKQFWITVHVPDNTPAGTYTGTITLSANDSISRTLTLNVTVPNFDLVESPIEHSLYYVGKLSTNPHVIGDYYKTEEMYRADLIDMKNHGVKNPTIYQAQNSPDFAKELFIRQELGMNSGPLYSWARNQWTSDLGLLDAKIPGLITLARSYGFTDLYIYGIDEAKGAALTAERPFFQRLHDLGAKSFVAITNDLKNEFDLVGDLLDIAVRATGKNPDYAKQWHSVGHKIYSYNDPQSGAENPQIYRRNFGVVLWAAGYDGAMDFAYQSSPYSPWNDFDSPAGYVRDEMFTYPTMDKPVDTIAWEGYREANDDNRYLATLEAAIASGRASSDSSKQVAANRAQQYLDTLRATVLANNIPGAFTPDFPIDLYAMRENLIRYISTLLPINNPSTPASGSCSTTLNSCTTGTFSDTADTSTSNLWQCVGTNGGTTASCSTPKAADTVPPTVSLTAPTAGTVSGTISVSATASDNVGVSGIQFKLDGINLGSEDASSPYSIIWDTLGRNELVIPTVRVASRRGRKNEPMAPIRRRFGAGENSLGRLIGSCRGFSFRFSRTAQTI